MCREKSNQCGRSAMRSSACVSDLRGGARNGNRASATAWAIEHHPAPPSREHWWSKWARHDLPAPPGKGARGAAGRGGDGAGPAPAPAAGLGRNRRRAPAVALRADAIRLDSRSVPPQMQGTGASVSYPHRASPRARTTNLGMILSMPMTERFLVTHCVSAQRLRHYFLRPNSHCRTYSVTASNRSSLMPSLSCSATLWPRTFVGLSLHGPGVRFCAMAA
jgi:hypothetical protein